MGVLYVRDTGAWVPVAAGVPDGARGIIHSTWNYQADGTLIVSGTQVPFARWRNVALVAGRAYRASWQIRAAASESAANTALRMFGMAGQPAAVGMPPFDFHMLCVPGAVFNGGAFDATFFPTTTGTYTVGVDCIPYGVGNNITLYSGGAYYTIEDLGPAVTGTSPT